MNAVRRLATQLAAKIPAGRSRRIGAGIVTGVLVKGISFSLTVMTVPMTLHYLGKERYGVWVTMVSMLAWLSLMDLGIANGLTPALSAAFGKKRNDMAREYVATAVWCLAGIAIFVGALIATFWNSVDWGRVFNVQETGLVGEISLAMALAVAFFLMSLPLAVNQRILLAYQEGAAANFCQLLVSVAGVAGIYFVTKTQGGLVYLVVGYSGIQLLVGLLITGWLFIKHKPELRPLVRPNLIDAKYVLSLGGLFFVCQLATLILFQKDNIIITYYLGPVEATMYSVAWQLFLYLNVTNIIIAPYLGPGFGEAHASGDITWMRKTFKRYLLLSLASVLPAVCILIAFHETIIEAWVGPGVGPTMSVILTLALWTIIQAFLSPIVALLVGVGRLRRYAFWSTLAATVSIVGSVLLIQKVGVVGTILASVVSCALLLVVPAMIEVANVLGYKVLGTDKNVSGNRQ